MRKREKKKQQLIQEKKMPHSRTHWAVVEIASRGRAQFRQPVPTGLDAKL